MESKETKYCSYCGGEISADAQKCEHCDEWLDEGAVSRNHVPNNYVSQEDVNEENEEDNMDSDNKAQKEDEEIVETPIATKESTSTVSAKEIINVEYSKVIPIRRLFLLILFTAGIYGFYWFYKNSCYLRDELGKDVNPIARTILMIVPLVNIFIFYQLLEDMNYFIKKEGIPSYSSALNTLIMIFLGGPNSLGMWVLINVQESINELWRAREDNLPIRREFTNGEIVVLLIGILIIVSLVSFFAFGLAIASLSAMVGPF